jgi:hypothetical protein
LAPGGTFLNAILEKIQNILVEHVLLKQLDKKLFIYKFKFIQRRSSLFARCLKTGNRCHDIEHNDTQHKGTQHKGTQKISLFATFSMSDILHK